MIKLNHWPFAVDSVYSSSPSLRDQKSQTQSFNAQIMRLDLLKVSSLTLLSKAHLIDGNPMCGGRELIFINETPISPFWHQSNFRNIQQEIEFYYKSCPCCSYCSGNSKVLEAISQEPQAKSTYIFLTINHDITQSI